MIFKATGISGGLFFLFFPPLSTNSHPHKVIFLKNFKTLKSKKKMKALKRKEINEGSKNRRKSTSN